MVQPDTGGILHGRVAAAWNVAYSGIITGSAQATTGAGIIASFTAEGTNEAGVLVTGLRLAARQVADWLDEFGDTDSVLGYLTREAAARDLRMIFPAHRPLRLFTAAALPQ